MSFDPKSKDKAGELSTYRDMRFQGSLTDQERLLSQTTTLYIGNLSYFTSEEQVWELFRRTGDIRRVIMGLDRFQKTPCGFCFVEYYTRVDAEDALRYVNGTRLDDRVIRCDWDAGFKEGRQYGRGKHGGQVRDEYRQNFDAGRGGWNKTIQENSEIHERLNVLHLARENSVDVLMKHVLRNFLRKLDIDLADINQPVFKKAQVALSVEDLSVLRRYLQSERTVEEFGLREDLRFALENFLIEVFD
uniref:Nuclear cap-binding protein subunit 2 n=1 Tax=Meloidogyne hapla TaxID=6305 RepID=A0A1I8BPY3_MELHA